MKRIYMNLTVVLTMVIAILFSTNVFVSAQDLSVDGDLSMEEGAEIFVQTEDNLMLLEKKLAGLVRVGYKIECLLSQNRAGTPNFIKGELPVPCFVQSYEHYCGPATVKQVIHYYRGTSETQDYYADLLRTVEAGTTMTVMPGVLNACVSSNTYAYDDTWSGFSQWAIRVMAAIDSGTPVIVDIRTKDISLPILQIPYETDGHYLAIIGYSYDTRANTLASVKVADPHYAYSGIIWYPASDLYNANTSHFRHAMLW